MGNNALDAEPPIASFLKSMLIGGGPVNADVIRLKKHESFHMHEYDIAIPILPCKSTDDTVAFYKTLGFDAKIWGAPNHYAILTRDTVELHFFAQPDLDPASSSAGCYIRVRNVDDTHRTFSSTNLSQAGIPRMDRVENKPWGMREFAIVDLNGNLIRIGQTL